MELNKIKRTMARFYFCLSLKNVGQNKLHSCCVYKSTERIQKQWKFVDTVMGVFVLTKKNCWKFAYKGWNN